MNVWGSWKNVRISRRVRRGLVAAALLCGGAIDASAALPSGWTTADVGAVGVAGTANEAGGVFTVQGSGTDIWNGTDQFRFVYQTLSGDGEIVARVTSVQNTNAEAKAGVMFRESLAPGARHVSSLLTPGRGALFVFRPAANSGVGYGFASAAAPLWVKVTRKGSTVTAFRSIDGSAWTQVGQYAISLTQPGYIGLVVNSKNNSVLNTSTFDNVTVTGGSGGPPPPPPPTNPTLTGLAIAPTSVVSGSTAQGTVTLSGAALSGGSVVTLASSQTSVATVPASVTVAAGATTATFAVTAKTVSTSSSTNIAASYNGATQVVSFTVTPAPAAPTLSALSVTPASVQGGTAAQGAVLLTVAAPAGGAAVTLSSNTPSAASVPASVTIPAGSTSATFAIATYSVSSPTSVTIGAAYASATRSATLAVGTAPAVTGFYVAPNGTPSGDGTINRPWDLATALAHPAAVKPGHTIWLRGGTYKGNFKSYLTGTASAPIVVRQYPGERVTLDANTSIVEAGLRVYGADTWYWGFEITNSNPNRINSGGFNNPPLRATSVYVVGPRTKFINLVVHDGLEGFDFWSPAVDAEIYGTLVYNVGVEAPDRGHGHSIYVQNQTGTKRIVDNILFNGFSFGIHAYTGSNFLDNLHIEGNAVFNHGVLSPSAGHKADLYFGGGDVPDNPTILNNYLYSTPGEGGRAADLDNASGCRNLVLTGNYLVASSALEIAGCTVTALNGNWIYGGSFGSLPSQYPGNTWYTSRPTDIRTFVRPNRYEPGRAHIIVYNWSRYNTVDVDVSSVLQPGQAYEVRNAQNYFAAPVVSGTYTGGSVVLPMNGLSVAVPIGLGSAPPATGPDFNVFVLIKR